MVSSRSLSLFTLVVGSLAQTTTVTNVAATTTVSPPTSTATALSGDISFSFVNKNISAPQIPDHVNLECKNCSTTGIFQLISGGYDANDTDVDIATDFFDDGYLEFQARGVKANVSMELSLLPGFQLANFKVPIFEKHLFTLPLGDLANVDVKFAVAIPVAVQLNSEIDMFAGFTVAVPDGASVFLNIGSPGDSYVTGFNESTLTPLPFDVNTPNLSFNAVTGMEMTLIANASTEAVMNASASGDVVVTFDLPMLNTTVNQLHGVNATCDRPSGKEQTFDQAINVLYSAEIGLSLAGGLSANLPGSSKDFQPPELALFNRTFPLPTQCFKWDPASTGLVAAQVPAASNSSTSSDARSNGSPLNVGAASTVLMSLLAGVTILVSVL